VDGVGVDGLIRRLEGSSTARELGRRVPSTARRALRDLLSRAARRRHEAERRAVASFVGAHSADVRGVVLEVGAPCLTRRFGGSRVERSEVLDIRADNELATIVADLGEPGSLPTEEFDCLLLVHTLHGVADPQAALANAWRALAPGGVLLATVPFSSAGLLQEAPIQGAGAVRQSGPVVGARAEKPHD
jgi:SAM-dependent methyltransferase